MGNRGRPSKDKLVTYQVTWNWSDEFASAKDSYDEVEAPTAEVAIKKLRSNLSEVYDIKKNDLVIKEVYKI